MHNLLVSGHHESWRGEPWQIEIGRCVNEYTDSEIVEKYGTLDNFAIAELTRFPCIFAYESFNRLPPHFGVIRDVTKRQGQLRLEYELQACDPFLTADDLESMKFELDIGKWELNRTHWAVKDVNLPKELKPRGVLLPAWVGEVGKGVDLSTHEFDVALSFPGEARELVENVAVELERLIGPNTYFYDNNYVSQLARPSLDTFLQGIYRDRSKLIAVFLSADYQRKDWCGIEFRAIRDIIFAREHQRIMFIRTDDGNVDGVFATDGYVDARKFAPAKIAEFIHERSKLLK